MRKIDIMLQIAISLKILHDNGIYHFNLHPGNILLLNKYVAVISDFKASSLVSDIDSSIKRPYNSFYTSLKTLLGLYSE